MPPTTAPPEFEIKLELPPEAVVRLPGDRVFVRAKRSVRSKKLVSVYFDDGLKLHKRGLSLRVRRDGRRYIQTLKADDGRLFERGEWEMPIAGKSPELEALRGTPVEPLLGKKLWTRLRPIFETRLHRKIYKLTTTACEVELAVEHGEIDTGRRAFPICEAELELRRGDKAGLLELAQAFARSSSAEFAVKSKAQRGYELIDGTIGAAARTDTPQIVKGMPAAAAFQRIGQSCLRQIVANKNAVLKKRADGIHQMRIGLRRFRAALSLFADILPRDEAEKVKMQLRWLAGELKSARELDVLLAQVVSPIEQRGSPAIGINGLSRELHRERRDAVKRAVEAVGSPRFREMTLDIAGWLEVGRWTNSTDPLLRERLAESIDVAARAQLDRRSKKLRKRGRSLSQLDANQRHRLRIQAKKLRYATEFFETLFTGQGDQKRRKAFGVAVRELQDSLGDLNDIAVHGDRTTAIAENSAARSTEPLQRAFAAGLVMGHEGAREAAVLARAERAYKRFRRARNFWN
jgi:inorganic triphosphatase YgiF